MSERLIAVAAIVAFLAGCGGGGGGAITGPTSGGATDCSLNGQKSTVLSAMRDIYFWNDLLPATVDLDSFATPEALLASLTSVQPLDRFSFINSAAADAAFFGEGRFVGFGFSSTQVAADNVRFVRVFSGSPADVAGIARGERLLAVDGVAVATLIAGAGLNAAFGPAEEGVTRTLRIRRLDNSEYDAVITKAIVTIDPVPQVKTFSVVGTMVGYIEFSTFIGTATAELDDAFASFRSLGVTDVILDLRYNGGGLVSVAETLGDYLGGEIATDTVFSETLFNADNTGRNSVRRFAQLAQSINLSRLVVITTGGTASASELVINSLEPATSVQLVGSTTFGKPVGQVGLEFCEKILRPTAFETVNSLGEGRYFDGLPVDCAAADDLDFAVGSEQEASTAAALSLLSTGGCPVAAAGDDPAKAGAAIVPFRPMRPRNAAEEHAYVW